MECASHAAVFLACRSWSIDFRHFEERRPVLKTPTLSRRRNDFAVPLFQTGQSMAWAETCRGSPIEGKRNVLAKLAMKRSTRSTMIRSMEPVDAVLAMRFQPVKTTKGLPKCIKFHSCRHTVIDESPRIIRKTEYVACTCRDLPLWNTILQDAFCF